MSTGNPRRGELWVAMQARRLGFGRNPMRRPSDRFEAGLTLLVLLTALLMVPAGAAAGTSVRDASESRAAAQRVLLRQVQARTTADAPALTGQEIGRITWPVVVVWQDEYGFDHRGTAESVLGTKAGTELSVWIDRDGALAEAPRPSGDSEALGFAVGMGSIAGAWLVLWILLLAARRPLNRRRASAWATEWQQVAPRWTRRDT
ncbi:hypothetical protein OHA70_33520 [Kribbella sp. NBC_00382]|uniref:Rv1733c family protein n=1 Tax=Kribbella sp. NBC_00382 TaxID=2975967 RepID=UPI002E225937